MRGALHLKEFIEGFLAASQLVEESDQALSEASSISQGQHATVSVNITHDSPTHRMDTLIT